MDTFKVSNEGKSIFIYYLIPNIYTYISEYYLQKPLYCMLIVKYIYNYRCTCSSVEMLKWYMVGVRLGTPALSCGMQCRKTYHIDHDVVL